MIDRVFPLIHIKRAVIYYLALNLPFMLRWVILVLGMFWSMAAVAQVRDNLAVKILNTSRLPLAHASVELLKADSSLIKISVSDSTGTVRLDDLKTPVHFLRVSLVGYISETVPLPAGEQQCVVMLAPETKVLGKIVVSARKPFVELRPDRTVVNLDASITAIGSTVLEALEKLPGVAVDKDGNISLRGRTGVTVLLDGKQTYLSAPELANLLGGMSSAEVTQIELITNPSAKYDAAGNAGLINIKTKKGAVRGFNGSLTTVLSQGVYPKNNNNLLLNYRSGPVNLFLSYGLNYNESFNNIYAFRTYYNNGSATSFLEQPSFLLGKATAHTLRTGIDYTLSGKTSLGLAVTRIAQNRKSSGNNAAWWMNRERRVDSQIQTYSSNRTNWDNTAGTLNVRHRLSSNGELSADLDVLRYNIHSNQAVEHVASFPVAYNEALRADVPTNIKIFSTKIDYTEQVGTVKMGGGWKMSRIQTDNLSAYEYSQGSSWRPDLGKSNHFLYNENIHAFYASAQSKWKKLAVQGGLRFEITAYDAQQLGNASVKDSMFSRNYNGLFPSLSLSYEKDSSNTFTFSTTRRIDRPAFQKLNPFLFIINKYTYQRGNPYYRPQYTWNTELNHSYKNLLLSGISYSVTTDYFSQIFPVDSNGIVLYTEGNLSQMENLGMSVALHLTPQSWWSFTLQGQLNRKHLQGVIGRQMSARITQYSFNLNNQFYWKKNWTGEISGVYNSASQQDIQEVLDPFGQLSLGVSKTLAQNKLTLKLSVRDVFYTNWMKGLSQFTQATEYFKMQRDSRVAALSLTWRFGQAFKASRRSEGAATDEMQRVGND